VLCGVMLVFDMENVLALLEGNAVKFTQHFKLRIKERNIRFSEVRKALISGKIIEEFPNDQPLPSILILGYADNKPLHIVIGIDDYLLWLITVYVPSNELWENDFKTRKDDVQ